MEAKTKRFTETNKWRDPWFWRLSPIAKVLWIYCLDNCDHAGVIELYLDLVSRDTGFTVDQSHLDEITEKLTPVRGGRFWIRNFIRFQYGKLSADCKPHKPVFDALAKHGLKLDEVEQNDKFSEGVSSELRRKIIVRDEATCVYTGKRLFDWEIHIDHIVPRVKGGATCPENLVVMDASLNALKSTLTVEEFCRASKLEYSIIRERLSKATMKGFESLQDKEKDKDKDKEKDKKGSAEGNGEPPVKLTESYELTESYKDHYHKDTRAALHALNEASGRHFRETDPNLTIISARLKEPGVDLDGIRMMIGRQVQRWKGTTHEEYLRPETLFNRTKFDGYYAARDLPVNLDVPGTKPKEKSLIDKEIDRLCHTQP